MFEAILVRYKNLARSPNFLRSFRRRCGTGLSSEPFHIHHCCVPVWERPAARLAGSWFCERMNKMNRPLAQPTRRKKERTQINRIAREERNIAIDMKEIQSILRKGEL